MVDKLLNVNEAYLAMFEFLERYYKRTKSDDIGGLLGSMSLLEDGVPIDKYLWDEWLSSLNYKDGNANFKIVNDGKGLRDRMDKDNIKMTFGKGVFKK